MTMEPVFFALKVYGIVIVISFICAGVIWSIVHALSAMASKTSVLEAAAMAPAASLPLETRDDDDIPAEHIAAIAAAVHHIAGSAAILHIENTNRKVAWVAGGRMALHSSHNPVRNR
jgi:Oxaloacetate decarboxylase, gamma chain.